MGYRSAMGSWYGPGVTTMRLSRRQSHAHLRELSLSHDSRRSEMPGSRGIWVGTYGQAAAITRTRPLIQG
jgi:hypothetical protein